MAELELPQVLQSLLAAVDSAPDDVELRLHVAQMLLEHGFAPLAAVQASAALSLDPANERALALLGQIAGSAGKEPTGPRQDSPQPPVSAAGPDFDWSAAEQDLGDTVPPMFVDADGEAQTAPDSPYDIGPVEITLADVGGLDEVKRRLELSFLGPARNPDLKKLYGRSLNGGLLIYGPPGCGKTFVARALAGELGANFLAVSLADVLDMWLGQSERNLHDIFESARASAPCVLFLDEVDAIGQKRSSMGPGGSARRGSVNQLLYEMDSVKSNNEGLFVLGATNHPWDVDSALLRPGRFDRMVFVSPPDLVAREAILRFHLKNRPIEAIDVAKLAKSTADFSGADLAHLCDSAAELALEDSIKSGEPRMVTMKDFAKAVRSVKPSTGIWLNEARNVALFSNADGRYSELADYLKSRRML